MKTRSVVGLVLILLGIFGVAFTATQLQQQTPSMMDQPMGGGASTQGGMYGQDMGSGMWTSPGMSALSIDGAAKMAEGYLQLLRNPDLYVAKVAEYSNYFYVTVREKSTGLGAFDLLVSRYTSQVQFPPTMSWNMRYRPFSSMYGMGMMGMMASMMNMMGMSPGFMGSMSMPMSGMPMIGMNPQGPPLTGPMMGGGNMTMMRQMMLAMRDSAKAIAQKFLDAYLPGTQVGEVEPFHGYFDLTVLRDGKPYGIISVNYYSGQTWYHTWLGAFLQEKSFP